MADIREEKAATLFESIGFIFNHPWLFVAPFVIIISVLFAKLSVVPLVYQTSAIISYEAIGGELNTKKQREDFNEKIIGLTKKVLVGEGAGEIVKEVWPNIDPEKNPGAFEGKRGGLGRIHISYDQKINLSSIAYQSSDPKLCFKIVQATINALKREIKKDTERHLKAGLSFLEQQQTYYKNKIQTLDEEISQIKSQLRRRSGELTDKERILISEVTGERDLAFRDRTVLQKLAKYDEILAELQLQLLDRKKRKENLEKSMQTGEYIGHGLSSEEMQKDTYINHYATEIAEKEFERTNLVSKGYLAEHPRVKRLDGEIATLRQLKNDRMRVLTGGVSTDLYGPGSVQQMESDILKELDSINAEIETLQEKINLVIAKYEDASPTSVMGDEPGTVSSLALRLKGLQEEKKISQKYFNDILKALEEAQLKARVEEAEAGLTIVVIEKPKIPSRPKPFQKTPKIIWGIMLSLFIGTSLAYTAETLDNSIKSTGELRKLLHIPILGTVDKMHTVSHIRLRTLKRDLIIACLILFAFSVKFLLRFKIFQLVFSFIR